jgi:hypothetical protein
MNNDSQKTNLADLIMQKMKASQGGLDHEKEEKEEEMNPKIVEVYTK